MTTKSFLEKNKVTEYIYKYDMLKKDINVVLGLSGGPDSVCLFYVLLELKELIGFELSAVHVNHGIRGEEAKRDELFSKKLCEDNGVAFKCVCVDAPKESRDKAIPLEEAARDLRYAALFEAAGANGRVAVAHNLDDNAETILFHMARGCGLAGVCGIAPVNGQIIRPLLMVSKASILDFLKDMGYDYVYDSTNADTSYSRNYIRHSILGDLKKVNEKALEHIGQMSLDLFNAKDYIATKVSALLDEARDGEKLKKQVLLNADEYIRVQAIRSYLSSHQAKEKDVYQTHINSVLAILEKTGENSVDLANGMCVVCDYDYLYVRDEKTEDVYSHEIRILEDFDVSLIPTKLYTKWFDYDKIVGGVEIRYRQAGDYLVINSGASRKSLQDYMVNAKIPRSKRDSIPLVCVGSEVLWVVGYRMGDSAKVDENTIRVMEISFLEGKRDV